MSGKHLGLGLRSVRVVNGALVAQVSASGEWGHWWLRSMGALVAQVSASGEWGTGGSGQNGGTGGSGQNGGTGGSGQCEWRMGLLVTQVSASGEWGHWWLRSVRVVNGTTGDSGQCEW